MSHRPRPRSHAAANANDSAASKSTGQRELFDNQRQRCSAPPLIANRTHADQRTASWLEGLSRLDGDESH